MKQVFYNILRWHLSCSDPDFDWDLGSDQYSGSFWVLGQDLELLS